MPKLDRIFDKREFPEKMQELGYDVVGSDSIEETLFRLLHALAREIEELRSKIDNGG